MSGSTDTSFQGLKARKLIYKIDGLSMRYDLELAGGEILALVGPSGGGKTTLLNLIAGFLAPEYGQITYNKKDLNSLSPAERPVTFLFQEHNLFPHLSVFNNVAIGIDPSLKISQEDRSKIEEALKNVGLENMGDRLPKTLSGGQRQRVALARALVRQKPLLLLDEPFSALDPGLSKNMMALIQKAREDYGLTILYSTHSPMSSIGFADKAAYIENGEIHAFGRPEDILCPDNRSPEMQRYLGS